MRITALALIALLVAPAFADTAPDDREAEELRLQQLFMDDMADVVADLNKGSFDRLVRAIDADALLEKIFGLRLIDQRMKRDFRDRVKEPEQFAAFIQSQYAAEAEDGIKAHLLVVESRGDRGRAVVRFDMPRFQANYIEYDLRLSKGDQLEVLDWTDYLWGHRFSEHIGLSMVQAQPSESAARKLVNYPNVQQAEVFQLIEVLKATRDRNLARYFQIVDTMNVNLKRQRVIWKLGLDAARIARKRRDQRKVLVAIADYYPKDVLFALPLLDYYFPDRQYQNAYDALVRVRDHLRVNDGVSNARLSSASLVLENIAEANRYAELAVRGEPELELGWWSLLRARIAAGDFSAAIPALDKLRSTFGHELGPEDLAKDPSMKEFVRSPEYLAWIAAAGA
ncbi:MAG TPA: hypothetical protein PKK10_08675 [Woeseiaceae bacterium]|nr:hypothetical protein [Woeseiaceae bacterium]